MIPYLFHRLPGPAWVRATILATVTAGVVVSLFLWGFPALSEVLPTDEQTVVDG